MTARFSFIIVALGAALVFAVPAFGKSQPVEPQWMQALEARSQELNRQYNLGEYSPAIRALKLRSEALNRQHGLGAYPRTTTSTIDARERAFAAKREAQLASSPSPDWFERIAAAHQPPREPVVDDRFRIDPTSYPTTVTATSSDRTVEWPQLGLGFVGGIAIMLGLYFVVTREREPAL
jgi:hypothetical protein